MDTYHIDTYWIQIMMDTNHDGYKSYHYTILYEINYVHFKYMMLSSSVAIIAVLDRCVTINSKCLGFGR